MKIGGFQKLTLIDFPAHLAAIVFVKGCNFSCPFCFNRDLVLGERPTISQRSILAFLRKRGKILDGIVLTGGEPLLQEDLEEFIKKVRRLGYKIKLDTNGSRPQFLKKLLAKKQLDYVALDIKAPFDERYGKAVRMDHFDFGPIVQSIRLFLRSKVPFELRTTVVPGIHDKKTLIEMARQIKKLVGKKKVKWYWQNFQPQNCLDKKFEKIKPYSQAQLEKFLAATKRYYSEVELRDY